MYGSATWANALNELGKLRKGTQLVTILFVFKVGIVILSQEKSKGRKKPKVCVITLLSKFEGKGTVQVRVKVYL